MLIELAAAVSLLAPSGGIATQPQIAADGERVAVAFGADGAVYAAGSEDGARSFGPPARVFGETGGKLMLGRHRGPRIALSPDAVLVSAIFGGDLYFSRSGDKGRTWSRPVRVNDVPDSAREGLHAMAASGDTVFIAWLDLREKGTRLYGAVSRDGGESWGSNRLIYASPSGNICECCHPSVLVDARGTIYAMWRNWLDGNRDMYFTRSSDGGRTFDEARKLGTGSWALNACPMDGGGFTLRDGAIHSVWRRESSIYRSSGSGAEQRLGQGKDAAIANGEGGTFVAWTEDGIRLLAPGSSEPVLLDEKGSFVQLASGKRVYAAWQSAEGVRVAPVD